MLYRALEVANDRTAYARRRFLDIALLWAHHGANTDILEHTPSSTSARAAARLASTGSGCSAGSPALG